MSENIYIYKMLPISISGPERINFIFTKLLLIFAEHFTNKQKFVFNF